MTSLECRGCLDDIVKDVTPEFEQQMFNKAIKELDLPVWSNMYRNIRYKMYKEAIKYDNRRYG